MARGTGGTAVSNQSVDGGGARLPAFFRLPAAPLTRVRLLFLVVCLFVAEQVLGGLLAADEPDPRRLLAAGGLIWACWHWFRAYARGRFPRLWLIPEVAVFLALSTLVGPERGLLVLAAGLWLRSLYGEGGEVMLGLAAYIAAYLAGVAFTLGAAPPWGVTVLQAVGALVINASVAHLLASMLGQYGQALDRARVVSRAGAELAAAATREEVYAAALAAMLAAAGRPEARAGLALGPEGARVVVAGSGAGRPFPGRLRRHLCRLAATAGERRPLPPWLLALAEGRSELSTPLPALDGPVGMLVVSSRRPLSPAAREALLALATQVALALARAGLMEELERREDDVRFRSLVQHAADVITVVARDGTIRYQASSVARVFGYRPTELIGHALTQVLHPDDVAEARAFLAQLEQRRHNGVPVEWRWRHCDGSWRHTETVATNLLDDPNVGGLVLTTRDISARKRREQQLVEQASHDPLTGLANRARFRSRVGEALQRAAGDAGVTVLYLDVDSFKGVNDRLGHAAGDALLLAVAGRLRGCLRDGDTLARLGGDEFAVLWAADGPPEGAAQLAERIIAALRAPFSLGGEPVEIGTSIGIATAEPAERADDLLHNADLAMYAAKRQGKSRYAVYESCMRSPVPPGRPGPAGQRSRPLSRSRPSLPAAAPKRGAA